MGERVAVVTGGTGVLGLSIVLRLVSAGARVWVPWVSETELDGFRRALGTKADRTSTRRVDLTSDAEVGAFMAEVGAGGRLDVLANIAGGFASAPVESTDAVAWHRMMDMNATTAFLCSRHAVPLMRRGKFGRIINVASGPAVNHGAANLSAYAASKAAVLNLTESLAKELVASGITVNALVPSVIDTPANRRAMPSADTSAWLSPEDIAAVVEFLASDAAGIVTGSAVTLSLG